MLLARIVLMPAVFVLCAAAVTTFVVLGAKCVPKALLTHPFSKSDLAKNLVISTLVGIS